MKRVAWVSICLSMFAAAASRGADRVELEETQIIGNRELPKVLYIVPWKEPLPTDLVGRPAQSLLDEVLAPLDREVFRREVQYHAQLQSQARSSDVPVESKTD